MSVAELTRDTRGVLTLALGETVSVGYWSGERMAVRRARTAYPCACGHTDHTIRRGDLYLVITPDRLAAWGGHRYVRRLHVSHAGRSLKIVDGRGRLVGEILHRHEGGG